MTDAVFAYSWKLRAYRWQLCVCVLELFRLQLEPLTCNASFFTYNWSFFCLQWEVCLTCACKQLQAKKQAKRLQQTVKRFTGRSPCTLRMGVANSLRALQIKHPLAVELRENRTESANWKCCDLRFGALSFWLTSRQRFPELPRSSSGKSFKESPEWWGHLWHHQMWEGRVGEWTTRVDFREWMRTAPFQFSESSVSLSGPDLFTELPCL